MILHNISSQNTLSNTPTLQLHTDTVQKGPQVAGHAQLNNANQPAATFRHAGEADYSGKKLSPLQRSILQLQEQIEKAEANDKMGQEEKEDLLKSLNEQLKTMEEQLNKEQQPDTAQTKDKKSNSNSSAAIAPEKTPEEILSNAVTDTLLTAASGLKTIAVSSSIAKELKNQSAALQHAVDNGIKKGWIGTSPDPEIIDRRQGEADDLKSAAQSAMQELTDEMATTNEAMATEKQTADQNVQQSEDEERKPSASLRDSEISSSRSLEDNLNKNPFV